MRGNFTAFRGRLQTVFMARNCLLAAIATDLKWTSRHLKRLIRTVRVDKKYKIYYIIKSPC